MRRRSLLRRLLPPVLIAASVLVGVGCGVINPDLLGTVGISNNNTTTLTNGMVVMVLLNETNVTASVTVVINKTIDGVDTDVTTTLTSPANDHIVLVDDCAINSIQVTDAVFAGTNGAVTIPSTVSPAVMGETLQCGGGVVVTISGTAPGIFLNAGAF